MVWPYLRVSRQDRRGRTHSMDEQADDLARGAAANNWTVGEPYADPGLSASRFATKPRGDFERLLDDLRSGAFGSSVLGLWELSRGSRQVSEWVLLLDLLEKTGARICVSTHGRP